MFVYGYVRVNTNVKTNLAGGVDHFIDLSNPRNPYLNE